MASQSTGIQQLLAAEKKAAERVSDARKRKAKRLKEAKEEAHAEIEAYRQKREKEFREHENKVMGSKGDTEKQVEDNMNKKLAEMNASVHANEKEALERLITIVCEIKPVKHINLNLHKDKVQ